jgi:two-component system chemotaxis response regulator CheY
MRKVLVADDSPTMRRMVIASLRGLQNVDFIEAGNGFEAIEHLTLEPVSLMILDLNMPEMHGLEVLRFLQAHEPFRNIPVVVVTTKNDRESRQAALDAGARRVLNKPFEPAALMEEARELLGKDTAA